MSIADKINEMLLNRFKNYVTVEEILEVFNIIAHQMDFAEKYTHKRQSVLGATHIALVRLIPVIFPELIDYTEEQYHYHNYCEILK